MPYYLITEQHRQQHLQAHLADIYDTETESQRVFCTICYPIQPHLPITIGFLNFWNWIHNSYTAYFYTRYTIVILNHLEEYINQGDTRAIGTLIVNINFNQFLVPFEELAYYVQKLYVDTNKFERAPTLIEIAEAQRIY